MSAMWVLNLLALNGPNRRHEENVKVKEADYIEQFFRVI